MVHALMKCLKYINLDVLYTDFNLFTYFILFTMFFFITWDLVKYHVSEWHN